MICNECKKNPATIHLTEIIEGKITEIHLCEECARKKSEEFQKQFSIADFLSELVDIEGISKESRTPTCNSCGLSYEEFKKRGRLGCKNCYESFKDQLYPLLRKIHGSIHHRGKLPRVKVEKKIPLEEKIKNLKVFLERAIRIEEYEEAARIRDEIKELEKKLKNKK